MFDAIPVFLIRQNPYFAGVELSDERGFWAEAVACTKYLHFVSLPHYPGRQ